MTEQSIKIKNIKPFDHDEKEFGLEGITDKYYINKHPNQVLLIINAGLFVGILVTIFSHYFDKNGSSWLDIASYTLPFSFSIFLSYIFYESNFNLLTDNGKVISFYTARPTKAELETFLSELRKHQKDYLLKTYAKSDGYLTNEQISNNLQWLWHRKIIDDIELNELRLSLLPPPANTGYSKVGFTFKSDNN
ncbi:MAG: hypothetical protein JSU01_21370 [Bacteroidetes bacterium]|nr:hypothetical protein [Bacteroidota bacterium]